MSEDERDLAWEDRVNRLLGRAENRECPNCLRVTQHAIVSRPDFKTYLVDDNRLREWEDRHAPRNVETIKIFCSYCGYVREFAVEALEAPDAE